MNRILLSLFLLFNVAASAQRSTKPAHGSLTHSKTTSTSLSDKFVTSSQAWDEKETYVNGFARVLKNGKFSFVDVTGKLITALQFEDARNFVNKLAAVKKDSKWGFINEIGKLVIPFEYEIVYDFKESVTGVFANQKWALINTNAVVLKQLDITVFYGFDNGEAKVLNGSRKGILNTSGEIIYSSEPELPKQTITRRNTNPVTNVFSACPDNIDFENGNLNNWNCFTGYADSVGSTNVITVTPSMPVGNRHRLYGRITPSAIDPYGLFATNPPDGSNFAVKLGNTRIGAEAERIQYILHVPVNDSNFSIRYDYAVVFQDPGHTTWTQPRFTAKLFDSAANAYIDCASFEYISTSSLPGFAMSTVDSSVIFKDWASVFISLRGHAGQTLYLEFTTADCVRRGHWGYAYVDVESTCSQAIDVNYECETGIATLNAPPGFQTYNWWNDNYSTILGTGQNIVLNPAPPANSTIWLEMIPFSDFGCRDSMPVTINSTFTPHFDVSENVGICAPHSFTFYNRDLPSASVIWDFGDGSPAASGDTVTHTYLLPGTYTVTMTVTLLSGCTGVYQATVRVINPTGSFDYTGGNFCNSTTVNFSATMSNGNTLLYNFGDGNSITTTQTSISHTYSSAGVYLPSLTIMSNQGCSIVLPGADSIKIEILRPDFTITETRNCGFTVVGFKDISTSYFGISSNHWNFGDGTTATGINVSHTYTTTGTYPVQLTITGVNGCIDSITQQVSVVVNNIPVAAINGPDSVCLHTAATFTGSTVSTDPVNTLEWTASDNSTGSGATFTNNFLQAGVYTVQLVVGTVNGCFDSATAQITINPVGDMIQPANIAICNGAVVGPIAFSSTVSGTAYSWTNNDPSIGLAATGTGDIGTFTAVNTTSADITATITVTPTSNGCPGTAKTFTIIVAAMPTVTQPADQIVCNRGTTAPVIINSFARNTNSATFNWTNNQPGIGLAASGTGNIPSFTAINTSALPVTATITISIVAGNGCPGVPQTFTITVNPTPDMTQPASQVVCNLTETNSILFESTVNGAAYSWTNNQTSIGLAASGSDSIASFNAINNTTVAVTANITVSGLFNGCYGNPATFSILVNPTPDLNQPADQSVCTGYPTTIVDFTGAVAGTIYNWTNNVPSIGLPASGTGDLLSFNPNNNSNTNLVATITVTPTANGCAGLPKTFTVTIFPTPGIIQPLNQYQCNGEPTTAMTFISPVAGTSFTWTNSLPSIGLPATGSGNIPSFMTNNSTNQTIVAAITVTPSTNACPGIPKVFYITVDPTPNITQPVNQTVCSGETVTATAFVGSVAGTGYTWINSAANIGLAANGTGDIPSFTATNNTNFAITAIIQVTGSANSCGSVVKVFTITVNPTPAIDEPTDQVVCNRMPTAAIPLTGPVSGTVFSWKNNTPSIGLAPIGTGDIPSFIAINNTNVPVVATIIISGMNVTCGAVLDTMTITVNPSAAIQASHDMDVCAGSLVQLSATGATQFTWTPSTGLSCNTCANPTVTPTDSILYKVKGLSALGCLGFDSVLLVVRNPFQMRTPPNDTICSGRSVNLSAANANSYVWSPSTGLDHANIANPTATPNVTTQYQVVGYDAYHCFTDTGYVTIAVGPTPSVHIGGSQSMINGSPITFNPTITNGPIVQYSWTPAAELSCSDCPSPSTIIHNNTSYTVTVVNSFGCSAVDSIFVTAFCKKAEVFVPNAFTPDGDGLNDVLMIRGSGVHVKSFRVFNRWGVLIFEKQNFNPNDIKYGWDGKVRGVAATPDVYVYTAEVVCDNGSVYTYKGNTTILK
ncbi:MAG: PKD domain-containing protein [Ferruginibacter sp.]